MPLVTKIIATGALVALIGAIGGVVTVGHDYGQRAAVAVLVLGTAGTFGGLLWAIWS